MREREIWTSPAHVVGAVLCVGSVIATVVSPATDHATARLESEKLIGISAPSRRAEIAPEQDGTIVSMPVNEGNLVTTGQVLFQLNSSLLELEVERLEALANTDLSALKAQTALDHARHREQRTITLAGSEIASTSELQDRQMEAQIAALQLRIVEFEQAQALNQWKQAMKRLQKRTLRSPIDGVVGRVFKHSGETTERLTPVMEIITLDPLWVEFECPVAEHAAFQPGADVLVTPSSSTETRTARIVYVSMEANPSTHTFLARAAIPNRGHTWRAGLKMFVQRAPEQPVQSSPPAAPPEAR